jgi:hypothetical protein
MHGIACWHGIPAARSPHLRFEVHVNPEQDALVLSNAAFDRFIAELDKPAAPVKELVDLFERHPKLREE